MIKPWLSKNFLQMMTWSNVRDYPPKKKKPWLFDNFMEMEEIHADHMDEPFEDPLLPLPPSPDIPQEPEEPDPCIGDRSLWVTALPSSVDCDGAVGFTLTFSPDFACIELKQAFFDEDDPKIVDANGNDLQYPTNIEDIVGGLRLEKGCNDPSFLTLWAIDCLCGGQSSVDIFLDNCGVDCDSVDVSGPTFVSTNGSYQYELINFPSEAGQVQWAVAGAGASIGQDGVLSTSGACGMLTVIASSNCCGAKTKQVKVIDSGVWLVTDIICNIAGGEDVCCITSFDTQRCYSWQCNQGTPELPDYCEGFQTAPCGSCSEELDEQWVVQVTDTEWSCPP